ncbi:MAG: glycosyltransferase family 2 protein [Candidatus Glassbacteria bacterium]|nr:glycosyltransferase family 2 protein [Candidatus Glassbacteria bacterium]
MKNRDKLPPVSVIVVTLDNRDLLAGCLESLENQDYPDLETIVVDNGSVQDIGSLVKERFPRVRLVRLEENQGFAGGNNHGIRQAGGEYLALINNDASAAPDWISRMVEAARADSRAGAVASLVLDGNRPGVLDSLGVGLALDGMSRQRMKGLPRPRAAETSECPLFSGCACLLRKSALDEVGLFDEDFFAYCEDTDLGLRLRLAGWKVLAAPRAEVTHYYSRTGGEFSLQKIYWVERNHFWVAVKNFPLPLLVFLPVLTLYRCLVQFYLLATGHDGFWSYLDRNRLPALIRVYCRAWLDMLLHLPKMWHKRLALKRSHRLGARESAAWILRHHMSISQVIAGESKSSCP